MTVPVWRANSSYTAATLLEPTSKLMTMYQVTTPGISGLSEPAWPDALGATVADGTVVWTCLPAQTITWTAEPLFETGATEPVWGTTVGGTTVDGTVTWTARTAAVTDPKCPQSKLAFSISSKIFSPYKDVLRYCATNVARDWSTVDDAGFLPTGQQSPASVEITALGEYRGRLAAWTSSNLMIWTTDPDPAEQSLFDNIAGIGTQFGKAVVSIGNDLVFLTNKGYKSLAIAASATNLATNDVGTPIDTLIQAEIAGPYEPKGFYYPSSGQFWGTFGGKVYVLSNSTLGKVGGWSYYEFPFPIEYNAQLNGEIYLRSGDNLYRLEETSISDNGVEFEGIIWWNYLDLGAPGALKMMQGLDIVGYGVCEVSVGYDQNNLSAYTAPFEVGPDTVPGGMVPLPLCAPSFALKLRYLPGQSWSLLAAGLYADNLGVI